MIGDRLKQYLEQKGLRASDLAREVGLTQGHLSDILNNKKRPSAGTLAKINQNTDINIDWLLTGNGEMFIKKSTELNPVEELKKLIKECFDYTDKEVETLFSVLRDKEIITLFAKSLKGDKIAKERLDKIIEGS